LCFIGYHRRNIVNLLTKIERSKNILFCDHES
jgi:hypothetical protein